MTSGARKERRVVLDREHVEAIPGRSADGRRAASLPAVAA
jgi:hypothetical protein